MVAPTMGISENREISSASAEAKCTPAMRR